MADTKVLQSLVDGQKKILKEISDLRKETRDGLAKVNERLDKQGRQLAYLEDDAPTREEFDELDKRVTKVERKIASS
jgi:hypothetical protein